ncbi:hypothetical protein TVAG_467240 [Trichomonas vaginalis G3]|uniref:Ubiquitin-like domain-containing protein n=1 Tax=Trichomonas vaginalis (strain ATCC PRA-98 / G3) TaxID=412133 RepID=A2FQD0_TRIV3|nr:ubiquitin-like family [Trichomonas vaginalis G3]EAX92877.1 hypothetical protein TVAG_467240 [Trichomonas vaginalis G3]KAI5494022.1 ubiquitin-like family [Trichomonas vaginalis G3]|eukprot:XP_001305807.1 hypothetical protein [Trichomonas vaginalis G3]
MNCYIVRILPTHDFFVTFKEPLSAGEVKDEMFLQIGVPTRSMTLIFNGTILQDHVMLDSVGAKHTSILYMVIKQCETVFLRDPRRTILEIVSLISYLSNVPSGVYNKAFNDIRDCVNSPCLEPVKKLCKELNPFLKRVLEFIDSNDAPFDESAIDMLLRYQDYEFNILEGLEGEIKSIWSQTSSTIEVVLVDNSLDEIIVENTDESEDYVEPTNLDYTSSINSDPLPFCIKYEDPDY